MSNKNKRVFLDYASTTPTDKSVVKEMLPYFSEKFHNASSLYKEGVLIREEIDNCRLAIAKIVQCKPNEIIFTGSGTESVNLAILGTARELKEKFFIKKKNKKPHIITTNIEHVAVLETISRLKKEDFEITILPVNEDGLLNEKSILKHLKSETVLISIMLANNEIGTILPIRKIGIEIAKYKKSQNRSRDEFPYLHTDASQAANYLDINIDRLSADLLTLDGSKIYGPKGVGCLIKKRYVPMQSIFYGGSHEFGLRPSTENLSQIVGFTKSLLLTEKIKTKEIQRIQKLQKYFLQKLQEKIPEATLNGDLKNRLPNNINICIKNLNSEFAVIQLDDFGVCCAAMTACKNLSAEANSYVVNALGKNCGRSSIRFSLGRQTIKKDIDFAINCLDKVLKNH